MKGKRNNNAHRQRKPSPSKNKRSKRQNTKSPHYRGVVQKNLRGFAFIVFEGDELEDLFVPARDAEHLFHGDRLELKINNSGEVLQIKILSHQFREVVGQLTFSNSATGKGAWLSFQTKKTGQDIYVPQPNQAREGDWVRAELVFDRSFRNPPTGKLLEVYGKKLPATADIQIVTGEFNLTEAHSTAAINEASKLKLTLPENRKDLREIPFVTIDGEDARDFDDAVHVEKKQIRICALGCHRRCLTLCHSELSLRQRSLFTWNERLLS